MSDNSPKYLEVGTDSTARRIAVLAQPGSSPGLLWLGGFKSDMRGTKAEVLARITFEKLGLERTGERDVVFGLGLVQAPASCSQDLSGASISARREPQTERHAARRQISLGVKQ